MSAEVRKIVHLRCDGQDDYGRCLTTFGVGGVQPATIESVEGLARNARYAGWRVLVGPSVQWTEGIGYLAVNAYCPAHSAPPSTQTPETP